MTQEEYVETMLDAFAKEMRAQQLNLERSFGHLRSSLLQLERHVPRDRFPLLVLQDNDSLLAQLPTQPPFAVPLRLLLSWVCHQAGMDLGQIDDAKIGVSEAFLTVCRHAHGASKAGVQAMLSWGVGGVVVRLIDHSGYSGNALQPTEDSVGDGDDELGMFIISTVMDGVRVSGTARGGFQIEMHKSAVSANGLAGGLNSSKIN